MVFVNFINKVKENFIINNIFETKVFYTALSNIV